MLATGAATLSVNNTLGVTATVQEALIFTINDTTLNLNVDPSANSGIDDDESTTFNVSSNAAGGFVIMANMNQALTGANTSATIANTSGGGENAFSYGLSASNTALDFTVGSAETTTVTDQTATDAGSRVVVGTKNIGTFQDTIYYYLNVDYTMPADTYTAVITYTAVPTF